MRIITTIADMQALAGSLRTQGKMIGLVPTMGFLHEGHLSLLRSARRENDALVASIFVNPTQFGPREDLDRYPRDPEGDRSKCESAGVDVLFMPEASEMYPDRPSVFVTIEGVSDVLEGAVRPGHFRGVATVVAKLFHIVQPHRAYFGQKDYQQCAVIRRMVHGLNMDVSVAVLPTVREQSGLAMSSRNSYLNEDERQRAAVIWQALGEGERSYRTGMRDPERIRKAVRSVLEKDPALLIDYIEVADPVSLAPLSRAAESMVVLVAVRIGSTRLIDNFMLE